jgi:phosphoglycolate phosphatase-like HAD superfamily hydrolase
VRLVLWDIDFTLVDTTGQGRKAFEEAFEAVVGHPPGDPVPFAGYTDHQIAVAMLEKVGQADAAHVPRMLEELGTALAARADDIRAAGRALPGAREALQALAGRKGVVSSVLTGNIEANAALKLAAFGLESLVDLEVGGYGSDPHGSRSDLVAVARERAAKKYGSEVTDTVLVGDTPLDVRAAHEGGARAVAVASGPYGLDALRVAGADQVLEDLRDTDRVLAAVGVPHETGT